MIGMEKDSVEAAVLNWRSRGMESEQHLHHRDCLRCSKNFAVSSSWSSGVEAQLWCWKR